MSLGVEILFDGFLFFYIFTSMGKQRAITGACFVVASILNVSLGDDPQISKVWTYPLRPGVPAWGEVEDHYAAVQIPKEVVAQMSTADLADSCVTFPLVVDLYAAPSMEKGFEFTLSQFPPLQVLFSRPSAGEELIKRYEAVDVSILFSREKEQKMTLPRYAFLCQMLKRDEVVSKLDDAQVKRLLFASMKHTKQIRDLVGRSSTENHSGSLAVDLMIKRQASVIQAPAPLAAGLQVDLGMPVSKETAAAALEKYVQEPL